MLLWSRLDKIIKDLRKKTLDLNDVFEKAQGEGVSDVALALKHIYQFYKIQQAQIKKNKLAIENLNEDKNS